MSSYSLVCNKIPNSCSDDCCRRKRRLRQWEKKRNADITHSCACITVGFLTARHKPVGDVTQATLVGVSFFFSFFSFYTLYFRVSNQTCERTVPITIWLEKLATMRWNRWNVGAENLVLIKIVSESAQVQPAEFQNKRLPFSNPRFRHLKFFLPNICTPVFSWPFTRFQTSYAKLETV